MPQRRPALALLALAVSLLPAAVRAEAMPKMSRAEVLELFQAAGFPLKGKAITDHCGGVANPGITFADLNGDGYPEAVFLDAGRCYATGHWISILRRIAPGAWVPVFAAEGTAQPIAHRTRGWYDLRYRTRGASFILRYSGRAYAIAQSAGPAAPAAPAAPGVPARPAVPAAPGGAGGSAMAVDIRATGKPTAAQNVAIRRALADDFAFVRSGEQHDLGYGVALADLNDDGRPDLFVQYHDIAWCGSAGCSGEIVLATPTGYAMVGIQMPNYHADIHILPSRHHGMHDLRFDDSPVIFRWNGREYR
jgi:hypothetical protein